MRLFNGSCVQIDTDSSIPAVGGMDAAMVRTYHSRLDYDGPFGHGWVHTYDQHPRVDLRDPEDPADDRVIYVDGEGSEIAFEDPLQRGTGTLTSPAWFHGTLERTGPRAFALTTKDKMVLRFVPIGPMLSRLASIATARVAVWAEEAVRAWARTPQRRKARARLPQGVSLDCASSRSRGVLPLAAQQPRDPRVVPALLRGARASARPERAAGAGG